MDSANNRLGQTDPSSEELAQPPISLSVRLTYWELYFVQVVLIARVFRGLLYLWGFAVLLWLALSALLVFGKLSQHDSALITQDVIPLQWFLALPFLVVLGIPLLGAQRALRSESGKRVVSYQFSHAGISIETTVSKSQFAWAAIQRINESRSSFLLFTSPNIAFVVPKRCFESLQDVADLRGLVRSRIPNARLRSD